MKRLPLIPVRCPPTAVLCPLLNVCNGYISLDSPVGSASSIGGALSGLPGGRSIVLPNSGRDLLALAVDGLFVFGGLVPFNGSYVVTISIQPASTNCVVTNSNDRVNDDVDNVQVTCQPC